MIANRGLPTVLAKSFQNKTARVIAALRVILAIVFLGALLMDPSQPVRSPSVGYGLLVGYTVLAAALFLIAWRSWWYDFHLSGWAFAIDVAVFSVAVWFTEEPNSNFNSPFTAFFFFLMFSATLRWNWRLTSAAAICTAVTYLAVGMALTTFGHAIDLQPFLRRLTYMGVIAVGFVLFAIQSRAGGRELPPPGLSQYGALEAATRYVAAALGAGRVAIVWEPHEEPAAIAVLDNGEFWIEPGVTAQLSPKPVLQIFDRPRRRCLGKDLLRGRLYVCEVAPDLSLLELSGVDTGLYATLDIGEEPRGALLVGDLPILAIDDLERAQDIAREVLQLIEERTLAQLERRRAIVQTREALSRDLHDSVAQALAGASFGLETLRQTIPEEAAEARLLASNLKSTLRNEQAQIREMIERLRHAPDDEAVADLDAELQLAIDECKMRWAVDISLDAGTNQPIAAPLAFECRQILREAVSNAVRHGKATQIAVRARAASGQLDLEISNDGTPFADPGPDTQPWSVRERILRLKGKMALAQDRVGPTLWLSIPYRGL